MQGRRLGLALFALGVFMLHVYTTLSFLWALAGMPLSAYPLLLPRNLRMLIGFTPAVGALLLVVSSLVGGREKER